MDPKPNFKYHEVMLDDLQAFAVVPKENCHHFNDDQLQSLAIQLEQQHDAYFMQKCGDCEHDQENWVCLTCSKIQCSRYVNNHMIEHNASTDHPVALSFKDFSFWCYTCDSYITSKKLFAFQQFLSFIRYGTQGEDTDLKETMKTLISQITNLKIKEDTTFTRDEFINGIKTKKFKNITILTGAGISVAAGIPDFRSPGTGLYSQLEKYKLPYPEAIFEINYFKEQPLAFYQLANFFLGIQGAKPVQAHKFIKAMQDQNQLFVNYTQNIDGLELLAGVTSQKLIQAHGHMRTAHCIECKAEHDIKILETFIQKVEVMRCDKCVDKGLIKPDIIFFGEQLPTEFFLNWKKILESDLIIVMGTSLNVQPFAMLPQIVSIDIPICVINRDHVLENRKNCLFIGGDIEDSIAKICEDLAWQL